MGLADAQGVWRTRSAHRWAKFKQPVALRYIAAMPQTATGKTQKAELKAMLIREFAKGAVNA